MGRPKYFGVIGNRDHIKINKGTEDEEKRPFWEFLDEQPDGWLCSLAYLRKDGYPETDNPMIWDCGAWSYKLEPTPKIGKDEVTPQWTLEQYRQHAKPGDFVVAPDHMFAVEEEIEARREFNRASAEEFLPLAKTAGYRPMAVIHGVTIAERVERVKELVALGYDALSVGGVAFRASSRKREIYEIVKACRDAAPGVWLHVLGLSAPNFTRMWNELKVDSYDGASHFKQAFTGGAFFTQDGMTLKKHKAARSCRETFRPVEEVTAPLCDCTACLRLREEEGIDTRTYGSNENNMGRAAHNLNMLMRAQAEAHNDDGTLFAEVVG